MLLHYTSLRTVRVAHQAGIDTCTFNCRKADFDTHTAGTGSSVESPTRFRDSKSHTIVVIRTIVIAGGATYVEGCASDRHSLLRPGGGPCCPLWSLCARAAGGTWTGFVEAVLQQ